MSNGIAKHLTHCAVTLALCCAPFAAQPDQGHIELTSLLNSKTLERQFSFSAYSPVRTGRRRLQMYGGMELAWFQINRNDDFLFNARVLLGVTNGQRLAPFAEIGTNLLDLLSLTSGDTRDCSQDQCDPDIDIKAGFRYRLDSRFSLSLFYQAIHFGNFHDRLTGNHDIVGASFGLHF